ncbi:MAG TPA: signal peptidase I [Actinomycetota bacterium]|nr:signal peptidase I [Actinomycetota bacterium]
MRQRYHGDRKRRGAAGPLAVAIAAAAGAWAAFRPFRLAVEGESMAPALMPGDWVVVVRPRRIRRGDVVVLEDPRTPGFELVKRIVGMPGDRLEVTGSWEQGDVAGVVLGADEYWVEGDLPERSTDSRTFGPVRRGRIRGVVWVRYWSSEWFERGKGGETG